MIILNMKGYGEVMAKKTADKPAPIAPVKTTYREQYGVIVVCDGERHQKRVYDQLKSVGLKCKVVVT